MRRHHVRNLPLKIAIVRHGRSQRAVCIDAGVSEVRTSDAVRGRATLTEAELVRLARALHVPVGVIRPDSITA
jgi:hypothetical protein